MSTTLPVRIAIVLALCLAGPVLAQTTGTDDASTTEFPPGSFLVHLVGLLVVCACVLTGFKLYTAIKGGRLGHGWLWMFLGLVAFACAQFLLLGGRLGFVPVWMIWIDALRLVSVVLFFVGINQLRKLLA